MGDLPPQVTAVATILWCQQEHILRSMRQKPSVFRTNLRRTSISDRDSWNCTQMTSQFFTSALNLSKMDQNDTVVLGKEFQYVSTCFTGKPTWILSSTIQENHIEPNGGFWSSCLFPIVIEPQKKNWRRLQPPSQPDFFSAPGKTALHYAARLGKPPGGSCHVFVGQMITPSAHNQALYNNM